MNLTKEKRTHTPGPWYTYQSHKDVNRHIACKDGKSIAKEVHHANARLIAAAPEMYEVLSELLDTLEMSKGYGFDEEYEKAREVLAKVEGGEG
tara:strand:+ start:1090 stop:1368 length:279 start_codon:yes stop_codon:yes gene_type:complete